MYGVVQPDLNNADHEYYSKLYRGLAMCQIGVWKQKCLKIFRASRVSVSGLFCSAVFQNSTAKKHMHVCKAYNNALLKPARVLAMVCPGRWTTVCTFQNPPKDSDVWSLEEEVLLADEPRKREIAIGQYVF